jgi:hypothetical protein
MKKELLSSKLINTDDISVMVLDRELPLAGSDGSARMSDMLTHPLIVFGYTHFRFASRDQQSFWRDTKGRRTPTPVYDAFSNPRWDDLGRVGCIPAGTSLRRWNPTSSTWDQRCS